MPVEITELVTLVDKEGLAADDRQPASEAAVGPGSAELAEPLSPGAVIETLPSSTPGTDPLAPAGSVAAWSVAAAARRELGGRTLASRAPTTTTGEVLGGDPQPAAATTGVVDNLAGDSARSAAQSPADPFAAIIEGVQTVIAGIVGVINQFIGQIVAVVNEIFTAISYLFVPPAAPVFGAPTVGAPDPVTGVVTGRVVATDANNDSLTYSGSAPTPRGSVVVNADGSFTYTPKALARFVAASGSSDPTDQTDTFAVAVSDGRGGVTQGSVTVPVTPASPSPIPILGSLVPGTAVAADGSVYQTSTKLNRLTSNFSNETYVTRVMVDGSTTTYTQPGQTGSGVVVGLGGTVYQMSWDGSGSDWSSYVTTVRAIRADGSIQDYTLPGVPANITDTVVAPSGTVYQGATTGSPTAGYTTATLAIAPDGTARIQSQPGQADSIGLRLLNDGAVYQLSKDGTDTHVSVFRPDGTISSYVLSKDLFPPRVSDGSFYPIISTPVGVYFWFSGVEPVGDNSYEARGGLARVNADLSKSFFPESDYGGGPGVASDGTVYWTKYTFDGSPGGQGGTSVVITRPDGRRTQTTSWAGVPSGVIVVAPNGLGYQLSALYESGINAPKTTVTAVSSNGSTVAYTQPGEPLDYPFVMADGGVGQMIYSRTTGQNGSTTLLRIRPDGSSSTYTQPGGPFYFPSPVLSGEDLYLTSTNNGISTIRRYLPDGSNQQFTLTGQVQRPPLFGPDGSIYLTSDRFNGGDKAFLSIVRPDGTIKDYQWNNTLIAGTTVVAGGVVYQPTTTGLWIVDAQIA